MPPARPPALDKRTEPAPPVPRPRPTEPAGSAQASTDQEPAGAPPPEEQACRERLARLGVRFEPMPPIANGPCGAPWPLRVSLLPDGLTLIPTIIAACPLTEALALWTRDSVAPAANRELAAHPVRIAIGTSYECRGQNRQAGAKLSEHAFADAIDVMGFDFDRAQALRVSPRPADTPEGRFQAAIRGEACRHFTTVLGPGSDASHEDHLHLDLRSRTRGFRLCQ